METSFVVVGREHEVVDDELAAVPEELGQGLATVRPLEGVFLLDGFPGKFTPPAAQLVSRPRERLLGREERLGCRQPLLVRNYSVTFDLQQGC
jgi:hypothetical protein